MKASELRIGNWAYDDCKEPFQVDGQDIMFRENGQMFFEPIPLTEEWLERATFEKVKWGIHLYNFQIPTRQGLTLVFSSVTKDNWEASLTWDRFSRLIYSGITSVHQLQNLYFALTGEELTIKP